MADNTESVAKATPDLEHPDDSADQKSGKRALGGDSDGGQIGSETVFSGGKAKPQQNTAMNGGVAGPKSISGGTLNLVPKKQPNNQGPDGR